MSQCLPCGQDPVLEPLLATSRGVFHHEVVLEAEVVLCPRHSSMGSGGLDLPHHPAYLSFWWMCCCYLL